MTVASRKSSDGYCQPQGRFLGKGYRDVRSAAARVVSQVVGEGKSLSVVLPLALAKVAERDRGFLQELCYGTLRWYQPLRYLLERLLEKPLKPGDCEIHALLCLGLYQLLHMRLPEYAAVSATVTAARSLGKPRLASLINAVLRNFQRHREELLAELESDVVSKSAHPAWLLDHLKRDWPYDWSVIVDVNNSRAPQCLRVNSRHMTRHAYLQRLRDAGIRAASAPHTAVGILLESARDVESLPGFREGLVSVQDSAAQLAAELLDLRPGLRVLDACAAPGGKTCHILEAEPGLAHVLALDIDTKRLDRLRENLNRLGLAAQLVEGDALRPQAWWDGIPYDRILVDAPCSAIGVIRRHPDIKLLRKAADIEQLAQHQLAILVQLWPLLATGGMLVYATCSVLRRENERVVAGFLAVQADAREQTIDAAWGRAAPYGRQILPGEADMDGFYYACLVKNRND